MNRPKIKDYKVFVKDGMIINRFAEYAIDLEKYCDELENTIDKSINKSISYTIELKSDDCKCYGCTLEKNCLRNRCFWQFWKEWCMQDYDTSEYEDEWGVVIRR